MKSILLGSCSFDLVTEVSIRSGMEQCKIQELTLKAIGSLPGLRRRSSCVTSCVNGPDPLSQVMPYVMAGTYVESRALVDQVRPT